jgi:hypothetical protein
MTKTTQRQLGIVLCTAMLWVCQPVYGVQQQESPDLSDLLRQFQSVSSLHFVADVEMFVQPTAEEMREAITTDVPVFAEFQYWAEGDRYRINSHADRQQFPGMHTEVAYDGSMFQLLLSTGTLIHSARESQGLLPVLPNPLLEVLQFRYPVTDTNRDSRLRLKDVCSDRVPADFFQREWAITEEGGRSFERAVFPGGIYDGQEYECHAYVTPGARNRPVRIDRVNAQRTLTTSIFSDYLRVETPAGPTYWPQHVEIRAFDSQGREAVRMSYTISVLEVNADIAPEVFVIDEANAARVWDDDRQEFVSP